MYKPQVTNGGMVVGAGLARCLKMDHRVDAVPARWSKIDHRVANAQTSRRVAITLAVVAVLFWPSAYGGGRDLIKRPHAYACGMVLIRAGSRDRTRRGQIAPRPPRPPRAASRTRNKCNMPKNGGME